MHKRQGGFTLIELLLVMVILVVLSSVVVFRVAGRIEGSRESAARASLSNLGTALGAFEIDCGRFPTMEEGLEVLASNPGITGWKGPYVKPIPLDPWSNPFQYRAPGAHFPESYDLFSLGPDGSEGADDVVNW